MWIELKIWGLVSPTECPRCRKPREVGERGKPAGTSGQERPLSTLLSSSSGLVLSAFATPMHLHKWVHNPRLWELWRLFSASLNGPVWVLGSLPAESHECIFPREPVGMDPNPTSKREMRLSQGGCCRPRRPGDPTPAPPTQPSRFPGPPQLN